MKDNSQKYSLERLSELTAVQERTIRAYIAQGLLPSPVGKGRGAHYTESHHKRLKVIKQLRELYGLPLDQIRQHLMTAADDEEVKIVPISMPSPSLKSRAIRSKQEHGSENTDEAFAVGEADALYAAEEYSLPYASISQEGGGSDTRGDSRLEQLIIALQQLVGLQSRSRSLRSESCVLLEITPDISLLIKGNYSPQEVAMFKRLAECLREALTRGVLLSELDNDN